MKISVVIPTVGRPSFRTVFNAVTNELKSGDGIVVQDSKKQLVENLNLGVKNTDGDIIVFFSERGEPLSGWREKLLDAFERIQNSGVVSFHPNIVQAGAVSRDFLNNELGGYFFWPEYIHYYADQELGERARKHNKYVEILDIIREHPKPKEDPYHENNIRAANHDQELYYKREKKGFPNIKL